MDAVFAADSFSVSLGGRQVLKAASVWAPSASITLILGRNGSGKSTLLRAALGLVDSEAGHVMYRGQLYTRPSLPDLANHGLYYLPDKGVLSRRISAAWQIDLLETRFGLRRFREVCETMGVSQSLIARRPAEISGGERMRVEFALAVSRAPMCLIADEPIASIEPLHREQVLDQLRVLARSGCSIIVTGHDVHDLLGVADHVVWMSGGSTHWLGSPARALSYEPFRREYLARGG